MLQQNCNVGKGIVKIYQENFYDDFNHISIFLYISGYVCLLSSYKKRASRIKRYRVAFNETQLHIGTWICYVHGNINFCTFEYRQYVKMCVSFTIICIFCFAVIPRENIQWPCFPGNWNYDGSVSLTFSIATFYSSKVSRYYSNMYFLNLS